MIKRIWKRFTSLLLSAVMLLSFFAAYPMPAYAAVSGTLTGLSNADIIATYTGTDDGANSGWAVTGGNSISGSVVGTAGMCNDSHYNTTLTITNNKPTAAILSFDYAIAQNSGTIQVAGTNVTENGNYSANIGAGASINIYIRSGSTDNATTIDITNLNLVADVQATTTFQPAENGSYTVDGTAITEETAKTQQSTTAYSLSATADSGYKFVGWYSVTTGSYLSTAASASLYFDSDQTVTAVFVSEDIPVFDVAGARFFDLNEANQYAVSNGAEKISLVSDGTLTSGDYTISSGVILLIPFDEANTCYTTAPATTGNSRTAPSVFRTLTMAEGASISVNGAISVSAKHYAYGQSGAGAPDGKYGYIYMNEGSSITINNGGAMYVYGFVSGAGEVTAKSGATVYENMQIGDFRGGSTTSGMNNNSQKIFPINQYFVQNIEVKLTLESGADEYIYTSIYAASTSTSTAVHFIGNSGAMFSVSEGGYFAKEYLPDQDRLEVTVNGNARINSLTLTLMGISISSANYVLPINNCMTLNVVSGTTTITQDVALLAGSVVNISEGATVQITSGSSLYVYDQDEWTQANYASNAKFKRVLYSPTRTYTRTVNDLVDARIDVNGTLLSDGAVYTTAGGADITSSQGTGTFILTNGAGTNTATYMYKDYTTTYDTIPVNSAKLHNGSQYVGTDEEYTLTDGAGAGSTYYWSTSDSKWKLQGAAEEITITFDANGGTGTMDAQTTESGTDTVLTANVFTYEGYTFSGWNTTADGTGTAYADGATVNLSESTTLYAQWTPNVTSYTVTWVDEDGTVLETDENVAAGTMPEYNGETPTKAGDAQYSYTFSGWTPDVTEVTGDITYKAVYTQTVNQYTVTWKNWDGTVLETDTDVAYGATPEYNGETPSREGDAEHTYTFTGWTPEISAVTGDVTYTATFETTGNTYTVTWVNEDGSVLETDTDVPYGTTPEYNGEIPTKAADENSTYTFAGWSPEITAVTGDVTYTATFTATAIVRHTVTFDANGGTGTMEPQTFVQGVDTTLNPNTFTREGYQFVGWNTAADGSGASYADGGSLIALTEDITLYAQWQHNDGWFTDEYGTGYVENGEKISGQWKTIDGSTYYFKEDGYIAKGVYETLSQDGSETALFVFDDASGVFLSDKSGLHDSGADTYWVENGKAIKDAGLIRIVRDDGEINYYYFGADGKAYKGTEEQDHYLVEKNNGLGLPAGNNYVFGADGVIKHFDDTSINGIYFDEASSNYYFCVDGVIIANGLMLVDGYYYYARTSSGAFVTSQTYWITKTNGLLDEGIYTFNEQGQIVFPEETEKKNGIVEENGSLYYYVDGAICGAGLIQIDGDYYYVKTSTGEVVHGRDYWVTVTNGLLPSGVYTFDESGKMVNIPSTDPSEPEPEVKNGIVEENGSLYYYVDGVRTAAGLIQIDGDYYYVKTSNCEVVHGRTYWVTVTNGLLPSGQYVFADDGKMILE